MRARLTRRLMTWAYLAGWAIVRGVPEFLARGLFRLGADLAWRRGGRGVRRLSGNLRRVVGPELPESELRVLVRAGLRSYARYWLEVFRLPVISPKRIVSGTRTMNAEVLFEAHAAGRGVVVALPHTGNWDHAGAWAVLVGLPFTTVAQRLEPAALFDRFVAFRKGLGMEVLPLTGGERPVVENLADRLRAGRLVCLLSDRDLSARGIEVNFFGGRARMPAGPALLSIRTGAPLVPVTLSYVGRDWGIRIHDPVPVPASDGTAGSVTDRVGTMTQQLADAFAQGIAEHPQDWHMLQRLWLDDVPAGERRGSVTVSDRIADRDVGQAG